MAAMTNLPSHVRPWLLLRFLSAPSQEWTLKALSDELGVSQKTVRRDLAQLQDCGFPIQQSTGPHGRKTWSCQNDKIAGLCFTFEEAAALYMGRQLLEPMAGTVFFDAAHAAFRKIRTALTKKTRHYLEQLAEVFHHTRIGLSNYRHRGETIDTLMIGIEDRQVTHLLYLSMNADSHKTVAVHPYGLVQHRNSLYLIAFVPEYNAIRHYKIDRIHDVELDARHFKKPDKFTLDDHLRTAFGIYQKGDTLHQIRVRFTRDVARYVQEHHWHETQHLIEHADGSLTLELKLAALEEFKSWVLSFGTKAVVEESEELRMDVIQELDNLREKYERLTASTKK